MHSDRCYEYTSKIAAAMDEADILIFTTPVYVYHTSGQMKTLLDHFAYRWMVHRPDSQMFRKQAVIISTAAGAGMKSTNKDIKDSLIFWGVGKIYTFGKGVAAISWSDVNEKKRMQISNKMKSISKKLYRHIGKVKPSFKVRMLFYIMRLIQKKYSFNKADKEYWADNGWLGNKKPW